MKTKELVLRAVITKEPIAAVVRIAGNDEDLRLRIGTVDRVDVDKGYATLKVDKGFRSVRFGDLLLGKTL